MVAQVLHSRRWQLCNTRPSFATNATPLKTYTVLRNSASGPQIGLLGRIIGRAATGNAPKSALRPAFGRPEGRFRFFPGSSPAKIRPGRSTSGPEALLHNIEYYRCLRNKRQSEPHEFIGFGAMEVTKLYVMQQCFRAGNRPSGQDFGRTATGKAPKSALRPAEEIGRAHV